MNHTTQRLGDHIVEDCQLLTIKKTNIKDQRAELSTQMTFSKLKVGYLYYNSKESHCHKGYNSMIAHGNNHKVSITFYLYNQLWNRIQGI